MASIINKFYTAFSNLDAAGMLLCYHDNVTFEDPAFGTLKGSRAKAMWQMLCESQKGKDFRIEFSKIIEDENTGKAHWEAFYTFSKTGRRVHNKINAQFRIKEGLIIEHKDQFNLYTWSKQALGLKGFVIGHTRYFKTKLQAQTNKVLDDYIEKKSNPN
jgi:ketosteroid isomerase-like protein